MLIDENILIDVPFQAFDYAQKLGIDCSKITDVFLTHSHDDHFQKHVLLEFAKKAERKINFYCHKNAVSNLELSDGEKAMINICLLKSIDKIAVTDANITALPANHMTKGDEQPLPGLA